MARVKVDLEFPEFTHQKTLKQIADRVIIVDIADRMRKQVNLRGKSYPKNKKSTTDLKIKKSLRSEVLFAEGKLFRSPFSSLVGSNSVKISIRDDRQEVADILQNKGVKTLKGKKKYLWFGISKEAEEESVKFMKAKIEKDIKNGRRRFTK